MKKLLKLSLSLLLLVVVIGTSSCKEDNIYKSGEITDTSKEVDMGSVVIKDLFGEVNKDEVVYVQGGQFSYLGAQSEDFYLPNYNVNITESDRELERVYMENYYIGRYEVTQALWRYVMNYEGLDYLGEEMSPIEIDDNLSEEKGVGDSYPMYAVSKGDIEIFLARLNMILGEDYRLPTSDEWEYAARGGNQTLKNSYPGANNVDNVAWYLENSNNKLHSVGQKAYNELSLYDMAGNVAEYSETDVLGGSYLSMAEDCRVTLRKTTDAAVGFRLALTPASYFKVKSNVENPEIAEVSVNNSTEEITIREGKKAIFETSLVLKEENDDPNLYVFDGWYNDEERVSKETNYSIVVKEDVSLTARYKKVDYITAYVEVTPEKSGKVTINGLDGVQFIPKGEDVTLAATANNGYVFDGWYNGEDLLSAESTYTIFDVSKDIDYIQAKFLPLYYVSIKSNWSNGGEISINEIKSNSIQVNKGETVTFKVEVNEGYVFDGWYNGSNKLSSDLTYTYQNISTDIAFTAKFKRLFSVGVGVSPIVGGTATVNNSDEEQVIVEGEYVTFKAEENEGYVFDGWYKNNYKISNDLEYRFEVTSDVNLIAKFKRLFKVSVESTVGGNATVNGSTKEQSIAEGEYATFEAEVTEEGYVFDGWYTGNIRVSRDLEYLFEVDKDIELTAKFREGGFYSVSLNNQWRLSSISNPNSEDYEGVYESYSNYNVPNSQAVMYIDINGYETFQIYVRSDAESTYDYVMVSDLDKEITRTSTSPNVKETTSGKQSSNISISGYRLVEFTNIDGGSHRITILYRKDSSADRGTDRGYILIPKGQ